MAILGLLLAAAAALAPQEQPQPLLLQSSQGEQRVRLPRPGVDVQRLPRFTVKVDPRNGGSADLLMLTEDMPAGAVIPWHRHLHEDEIVYTENGTIDVRVGNMQSRLGSHATVYIPRGTWVTIRNAGSGTIRLVAVFNKPAFGAFLRCVSVPPGMARRPLNRNQLAACMKKGDVQYR